MKPNGGRETRCEVTIYRHYGHKRELFDAALEGDTSDATAGRVAASIRFGARRPNGPCPDVWIDRTKSERTIKSPEAAALQLLGTRYALGSSVSVSLEHLSEICNGTWNLRGNLRCSNVQSSDLDLNVSHRSIFTAHLFGGNRTIWIGCLTLIRNLVLLDVSYLFNR